MLADEFGVEPYMLSEIHLVPFHPRQKRNISPSVILNNSLSNVRFVVCGDRGKAGYEFYLLTNAFDLSTWIGLSIAFGFTVISLSGLRGETTVDRFLISVIEVYKVLVEQGDPFAADGLRNTRYQFVVISALLFGLVMSNAYKNANVYRMTQPRLPLKYQVLEHLAENNFTLY